MRRIGVALAVLACAGCDVVYGLSGRADAAIDAPVDAPIDEPPIDNGCSTISMLNDTFDVDTIKQRFPGSFSAEGGLGVDGGRLAMTSVQADNYVTLESIYHYDIRDRAFTVHWTDDGNFPATGAYFNITLHGEVPDHYALVTRQGGKVQFVVRDGSMDNIVTSIDDAPGEFAYVRMRFGGGAVFFESSADGIVFIPQASRPVDGMDFVRATLQTYRSATAPQYAIYVDQIGDGTPPTPACPVAQLVEDFAAPLGPQWSRSVAYSGQFQLDNQSFLAIANGVTSGQAVVALQASRLYNLKDGSISIEIPEMVMPSPAKHVYLTASVPGGDTIQFEQTNGTLYAQAYHDGALLNPYSGTYNASTMRWWRIRNASGATQWELSANGTQWMSLSSTTALAGLERVAIAVQLVSTATDEDAARFDNVNLP